MKKLSFKTRLTIAVGGWAVLFIANKVLEKQNDAFVQDVNKQLMAYRYMSSLPGATIEPINNK